MEVRTEFGIPRTSCGCAGCQLNCRMMPGFLIPADLDRMIPKQANVYDWAEENLLASPGALAMKDGNLFRIGTLVPATKPDGSCKNLTADGRCEIHENAPFGCAFFDCKPERDGMAAQGLRAVMSAEPNSLYKCLWRYLWSRDRCQQPPEVLRKRMREEVTK